MLSRTLVRIGLMSVILSVPLGCEEPKRQAPATASSSSGDEGAMPGVDPNIAKAVESAAAQSAGPGGAADGPPPNGVFGPGEADKAHPKGAPRKVELVSEGSEPRVTLRAGPAATVPKKLTVTVAQRIGPQAMPTLEYSLGVKVAAPEAGTDEVVPAGAAPKVSLTVKDVQLAASQPGAVPRDLDKEVAKLKDSRILGVLAADGALSKLQLEPAKTADAGLRPALEALLGAVEMAWLPAPDKPVGTGGFWMVVDRAYPAGIEVVRYRVYRLTALAGKQATLTMDVRQYSVGGVVSFPGAPDGMVLTALNLNSTGKGTVMATEGAVVPALVEIGLPVQMQMEAKERPGQAMVLQAEMAFRVAVPGAAPAAGAADPAGADGTAAPAAAPAVPPQPQAPAAPPSGP